MFNQYVKTPGPYERVGEPCRAIQLDWEGSRQDSTVFVQTACGEVEANKGDWLVVYEGNLRFVWRDDVFQDYFVPLTRAKFVNFPERKG